MTRYWYNPASDDEYKKIGQRYPISPDDQAYNRFHLQTKQSKENENIINRIIRVQTEEDNPNSEFILYDLTEHRKDGLGNQREFTRTLLGRYGKPEPIHEAYMGDNTQMQTRTIGVGSIDEVYEFPFTKEKADELHQWCSDKVTAKRPKKTEYIVQRADGSKISVVSYNDWRGGDFDVLANTGNAEGRKLRQRTDVPLVRKKSTIADQAL